MSQKNSMIQDILRKKQGNKNQEKNDISDKTEQNIGEDNNNNGLSSENITNDENIQKQQASHHQLEIEQLKLENGKLKELVLREKAENENMRKIHEREISKEREFAISKFAKDIVDVLENLQRAKSHLPHNEENKTIIEGFDMNIKLFEDTLAKHGVKRIFPLNEQFDPRYHQAVAHMTAQEETTPGNVMEVLQAGYIIGERVLRPALVVVAN